MFLDSIHLVRAIPCLAAPGRIIVIGRPSRGLEEVIPYLATLPGVIAYHPETRTLTFRRQQGFLTLHADKVFITQVRDIEEGMDLLKALVEAINATWLHRAELQAVTSRRLAPRHLDIYEQLPRSNCRQCGEATCLAFAVLLVQEKRKLEECVPLRSDPAFTERRAALEAML